LKGELANFEAAKMGNEKIADLGNGAFSYHPNVDGIDGNAKHWGKRQEPTCLMNLINLWMKRWNESELILTDSHLKNPFIFAEFNLSNWTNVGHWYIWI